MPASPARLRRWWAVVGSARRQGAWWQSEAFAVGAIVVAIQFLAFGGYYVGHTSPSGDFLASYNTEAFAWWRDGGIGSPPEWVPYTWGGFPAAAQVQNGSWYLPIGIFVAMGLYSISGAAVLQALHVAGAGLGLYLLARRGGMGRFASTVGLVGYSFTTGFFTEAPYPDIVRGFALVPWILLCLSPLWPWSRWWSMPVGALLLWQAAVGIYPGVLVAIAYAGLAWVVFWQISSRAPSRDFLRPLALAAVTACALTLPKFLPQLGFNTIARGEVADLTVLSPATLATLVLPSYIGLPGVYSLNLLFVPAALLIVVPFVTLSRQLARAAVAAILTALALGVPQSPLQPILSWLPGIASSRFRLNDYLPILFAAGALLATVAVDRLLAGNWSTKRSVSMFVRYSATLLPIMLASVALVFGRFREGNWVPTAALLVMSTLCVLALAVSTRSRATSLRVRAAWGAALVVMTAASGLVHAQTVRELWNVDTVQAQESLWGETSDELVRHYVDPRGVQRPGRVPLPLDDDEAQLSRNYLAAFYTGQFAVGGNFVVHESASFVEAGAALRNPATKVDASALWSAAGVLITKPSTGSGIPPAAVVTACAETSMCDALAVTPVEYDGAGAFAYDVVASRDQTVLANEAFYPGWQVLLTAPDGRSTLTEARLGPAGVIEFDVPQGVWRVSMTYHTPLGRAGMWAFWCAVAVLVFSLALGVRARCLGTGRELRAAGQLRLGASRPRQ